MEQNSNIRFSVFICCFIIITQYFEYAYLNVISVKIADYFMNGKNTIHSLTYVFLLYSIGTLISKSSGSIIFGFIADIFGLNIAIKIPPFITLFASLIFIFSPSYAEIGYIAIILLSIARIAFEISVSGEVDNTRLYIGKLLKSHTSESFVLACKYIGILLATIAATIVENYNLPFQTIFIIAACCTFVAIFLRQNLHIVQSNNKTTSIKSILCDLINNKYNFMYQAMIYGLIGSTGYFHITFCKIYFVDILKTTNNYFHIINISILTITVVLASQVRFKSLYYQVFTFMILNIIILFVIIVHLYLGYFPTWLIIMSTSCTAMFHIPLLHISKLLLPKSCEATFLSTSHNLGAIIFSKTTLVICLNLWKKYNILYIPFFYPIIFILFSLIMIFIQFKYYPMEDEKINNY